MDSASLRTLSLLETEIVNLSKVVRTLSAAPSLADSAERSEVGRGVTLLKDVLSQWPGTDSIYVGYDTRRLVAGAAAAGNGRRTARAVACAGATPFSASP